MGLVFSVFCGCWNALCCVGSSFKCCCTGGMGANGVSATFAKTYYVLLLFVATIIAWMFRSFADSGDVSIGSFDATCTDGTNSTGAELEIVCSGNGVVYRFSFVLTVFFSIMFVGMIPAPTCSGERRWAPLLGYGFHRGFWGIKLVFFIGFLIGAFFISSDVFDNSGYAQVARIFSAFFIVLQVLLLIDFGYSLNEEWVDRGYDGDDMVEPGWIYGLITISALLYIGSFVGIGLMFAYYGDCQEALIFTTISTISIVIFTTITLFREQLFELPGAVTPAAVVSAYITYLNWSALQSNPSTDPNCALPTGSEDLEAFIGIMIAATTLLYISYVATKRTQNLLLGSTEDGLGGDGGGAYAIGTDKNGNTIMARDMDENNDEDDEDFENEKPWLFHLLMISASMYMAMLLTNWGADDNASGTGKVSMWVKITSQWLAILLFTWTLIAPAVLEDRDFM